jgi:TRAP-type mannitol/chloroaromatic compound transport system permease small subunit
LTAFERLAGWIDRLNDTIGRAVAWLALPVIACLFLQIPLREVVHNYYLQVNDTGQTFHATLFMIATAYAMRWDQHVRVDVFHRWMSPRARAVVELVGTVLFLWPWLVMFGWYSWPVVIESWSELEAYPDTWTPGYFLLQTNLVVFDALVGLQSIAIVIRAVSALRRR